MRYLNFFLSKMKFIVNFWFGLFVFSFGIRFFVEEERNFEIVYKRLRWSMVWRLFYVLEILLEFIKF